MSYDTTKLVKLAALKSLAEKVKSDYATKEALAALSTTVDGIISTGGETNILERVKVNGVVLPIAEKIVDILIATGTTNGTLAVNNVDIAIKGLAALAYKAQVSESDLDTALTAVLAAKATNADLTALATLVGTIPEGATSTTVIGYVSEAVAAIVAGADASFDTLKEIADWIASDTTGAAKMASDILTNAGNIADLTALVGTLPTGATATTVVGYIAEAIAAIGIGDYATTAAMNTALEGYVVKVDGKALSANDFTNDLLTKLNGITAGATKVAASTTNGNVKINDVETTVYTLPSTVLHTTNVASDAEVTEMLAEVFTDTEA